MGHLAGSFHFIGENEELVAERIAEQLNLLNSNGIYPDVEWATRRDGANNLVLCARTADDRTARLIGDTLKNMEIIEDYLVFEAVPKDPRNNTPYHSLITGLYYIDADLLGLLVDLESGTTSVGEMDFDEGPGAGFKKLVFN